MQYYFFGFEKYFFEGMLLNLISEVIVLIATVFILERLIKKHHIRMTKQEESKKYLTNLSSKHDSLAAKLEQAYIHYVTKDPAEFYPDDERRKRSKRLVEVVDDLDSFITDDFLRREYNVIIVNPYYPTQAQNVSMEYERFFITQFRNKILEYTEAFTRRYMVLIPEEILASIFLIEDTLNDAIFAVPSDHGLKIDISTVSLDKERMKTKLKIIGEEIINIKEYNL